MPDATPAGFVRLLARAAVRDGEPDVLAREARQALQALFAGQKSLVLDVQFTGFATPKGQPVGGVSPELLRGAGQLIMMRVSRVGFTPDVRDEDLAAFFELVSRSPGELGAAGVIGAMREAAPHGVYVTSSTGETYRPAPAPKPAPPAEAASPDAVASPETPAPSAESAAASTESSAPSAASSDEAATPAEPQPTPEPQPAAESVDAPAEASPVEPEQPTVEREPEAAPSVEQEPVDEPAVAEASDETKVADDEMAVEREEDPAPSGAGTTSSGASLGFDLMDPEVAFTDFEVLEAFPDIGGEEAAAGAAGGQTAPPPAHDSGAGQGDLYHFFRSSHATPDAEAADLPRLLAGATSLDEFDEVAGAAARTVARLVQTDRHADALAILEALIREAERPDRTRVFRESAVQSLRRAGSDAALQGFIDFVQRWPEERERVVRFFLFLGGDAVGLLESLLFRTGEPELRSVLFRRLVTKEGVGARLLARTMSDPAPGRTRAILELAATSELDADIALKWVGEAATHPDSTVRMDAARHAATVGGRGGLRVLVDLLGDDERLVKRAAIQGLGTMGDSAAVPFLARLLNDTSDEDVQLAVIASLGKIAAPDALPSLVAVVNKRQLFTSKKMQRVKAAALGAIGKITGPAARDVLTSVAGGKDAELAAEARRILSLAD